MKYLIILFFPLYLFANFTNVSNYKKELSVLESFDIEPSFINDPIVNKLRVENKTTIKRKHFFKALNDAYIFIPAVKNILSKNDIPQEFLFLAMTESSLKTRAYSRKKASGLWQFMPETAKQYNLKTDDYVDERRDLIKSTEAASKHLSYLHDRFGKWYLAAIAYNCGGGRLSKAIEKAGSDKLSVLLDEEKKYIPKESRRYIRKIVAFALMGNNEEFMLKSEYEHLLNRANAYSIATIQLSKGESLARVSKILQMPLKDLQKLNRHLKYDFVPPYADKYDVYIPYIKLSEFKQNYFESPIKNIYKIHVVKSGDTLSHIGKWYHVPYKVIIDFNKLKNTKLKLKQKLVVPIVDKTKEITKTDTSFYHEVKSGETLSHIGQQYNVSYKMIMDANKLKSTKLKLNQKLIIPVDNSKKDTKTVLYHKVKSGETLSHIGQQYNVSYKMIMDANKLKSTKLKLNQKLIIPLVNSDKTETINKILYHMVKKGDSLESISKAYKVSIRTLRAFNNIDGSLIKVGDRLKLHE